MDPLLYIALSWVLFCFCLWAAFKFGADAGQEKQKELAELEIRKWEAWKWRRTRDYFHALSEEEQNKICLANSNIWAQLQDKQKLSDRKDAMK